MLLDCIDMLQKPYDERDISSWKTGIIFRLH